MEATHLLVKVDTGHPACPKAYDIMIMLTVMLMCCSVMLVDFDGSLEPVFCFLQAILAMSQFSHGQMCRHVVRLHSQRLLVPF